MSMVKKSSQTIEAAMEHFKTIPWVNQQLSDPSFRILKSTRKLTQPGNGHSLTGETWNTVETIAHMISMYRPPDDSKDQRGELRRFYTFGTGLNAHPDTLHGGVVATLLDSSMGNILAYKVPPLNGSTFTVALNITYKKPVRTPSTVVTRAWITQSDGRKTWIHGAVESSTGEVYATAEGMWLTVRPKL